MAPVLETDIDAAVSDQAVTFRLTVTNTGSSDAELSFRSGQRVEVAVWPADDDADDPVWRASEGQMFTQMLSSDTVPAGERRTYETTWSDAVPGDYRADGEIVARDEDLTAETTFSV